MRTPKHYLDRAEELQVLLDAMGNEHAKKALELCIKEYLELAREAANSKPS